MKSKERMYGEKLNAERIEKMLSHIFVLNDAYVQENPEKRGSPVCVWGLHGIGKTELVREFANKKGWKFAYCAPAQFEEMGDFHGLPEASKSLGAGANDVTKYLPPEWVPTEPGPGILLLDDFNRADIRILRGCMQLLQNFAMFSWSLPQRWQIVCTANPEGGSYSVTPMDDAMLTRMLHVTMVFDSKSWASWAVQAGLDSRGIDFVLTYPELISGERTTPRSFTQFLIQIQNLTDLNNSDNLMMVKLLGKASLDDKTVSQFVHFVRFVRSSLIQPEELLNTTSFADEILPKLTDIIRGDGQGRRIDRLKTICTRLQIYLLQDRYVIQPPHKENLIQFLLCSEMDSSLRFALHRELTNADNVANIYALLQDARLANVILEDL